MVKNQKERTVDIAAVPGNAPQRSAILTAQLNAIQASLLVPEVLKVFTKIGFSNTTSPTVLLNYLESQSNYYLKKDYPFLSSQELSSLYRVKNEWTAQRRELLANFNKASSSNSTDSTSPSPVSTPVKPGAREAEAQGVNDPQFITLDKQPESIGEFSSDIDDNVRWCAKPGYNYGMKIRYSSPLKYDLACLEETFTPGNTDNTFNLYTLSFKDNAFGESRSIASQNNFFVKDGVGDLPDGSTDYLAYRVTWSLFTGDFNGDGLDEIGLSHPDGLRIYHLEKNSETNKPSGWYARRTYQATSSDVFPVKGQYQWCTLQPNADQIPIQKSGIKVGDFNGDKKDDLWCHNRETGENSIRLNNVNSYPYGGTTIHDYRWYSPAFSLDGITWCKNGQLEVGDFNGDGRSDVACFKSSNSNPPVSVQVLFASKDKVGVFTSPTSIGSGTLPVVSEFYGLNNAMREFNILGYTQVSNRLKVGDFDGDGLADLLYIADSGQTKILSADPGKIFRSKSVAPNGMVSMNGLYDGWCDRIEANLVVGDFTGDGKSDIACLTYARYASYNDPNVQANPAYFSNLFMQSIMQPGNVFAFQNPTAIIMISDFKIHEVEGSDVAIHAYSKTIVCDNRVRPDDHLKCEVSSMRYNPNTISVEQFIKAGASSMQFFYRGTGLIKVVNGTNSYSQDINIFTQPNSAYGYPILLQQKEDESSTSIASMLVQSGECIKMSMVTTYMPGVTADYTATGHLRAQTGGGYGGGGSGGSGGGESVILSSSQLYSYATQALYAIDIKLNPNDDSEILFNIRGTITGDIIIDYNTTAENC